MDALTTMAEASSFDFNTATLGLYRISGVAGVLLQKGGNLLANHMPFPDIRTAELGEHVAQMTQGYAAVKRRMRQVLISYDSGSLLIVMQQDAQLALLLNARADLTRVANAAGVFLTDHAEALADASAEKQSKLFRDPNAPREMVVTGSLAASNGARLRTAEAATPEISRWPDVRKLLEKVLGKVMGRAQVNTMITRVCQEKHGSSDAFQLSLADSKELARTVMNQVPNRSKRASLLSELEQIFVEANL